MWAASRTPLVNQAGSLSMIWTCSEGMLYLLLPTFPKKLSLSDYMTLYPYTWVGSIARVFPSGLAAHLEDQNEEDMKKIWGKMREKFSTGKWERSTGMFKIILPTGSERQLQPWYELVHSQETTCIISITLSFDYQLKKHCDITFQLSLPPICGMTFPCKLTRLPVMNYFKKGYSKDICIMFWPMFLLIFE